MRDTYTREMWEANGRIVPPELQSKLEVLAILMGGEYNVSVGIGEWGSGWFWDFDRRRVNIDPRSLMNDPEDVNLGVACHEGNHIFASDVESILDMWREPGFAFGFNAVEDPRVNEAGMKNLPGSRRWIQTYIEHDLSDGGGLDYKGIQRDARGKLGYVPKHMRWGSEIIRYWGDREFHHRFQNARDVASFLNEIPDTDVREVVRETLEAFEEFYQMIPTSRDIAERKAKAAESGQIFKDHIYPNYMKLVEEALDEQQLVDLLKDLMGSGALSPEMEADVKQKMEDLQQQMQNQQGSNQQPGGGQQGGAMMILIPWDKLSDKTKEAIKQAFDQLPESQQQAYEQQAQRELNDVEDDAIEKLRGAMDDKGQNSTHKEQEEQDMKQSQQEREHSQVAADIQNMEKRMDEAMKVFGQEDPYHAYLADPEVALLIREQDRALKKLFDPNEDPEVRHATTGLRPSLRQAMKREADPRIDKLFEAKGRPQQKDYRFIFLIDQSSSMTGEKFKALFKVLVAYTELFNKHGIEFAIVGYPHGNNGTVIKVYKAFDEKRLTPAIRSRIGEMPDETHGYTPSLQATQEASQILSARMSHGNTQHNYFITLTDGDPTDASQDVLRKEVAQLGRNSRVITTGLGIGAGTQFVNQSYPALPHLVKEAIARELRIPVEQVSNSFENPTLFAKAFNVILQYMIRYPTLFYSS